MNPLSFFGTGRSEPPSRPTSSSTRGIQGNFARSALRRASTFASPIALPGAAPACAARASSDPRAKYGCSPSVRAVPASSVVSQTVALRLFAISFSIASASASYFLSCCLYFASSFAIASSTGEPGGSAAEPGASARISATGSTRPPAYRAEASAAMRLEVGPEERRRRAHADLEATLVGVERRRVELSWRGPALRRDAEEEVEAGGLLREEREVLGAHHR